MSLDRVHNLLKQPESKTLEFKESREKLPGNLFETICAMLNRDGGDIILGVADGGTIVGVNPSKIEQLKANLVNLSNNPQKLDPPFILFPEVYTVQELSIIHIQVLASSQVHKTDGAVYDRSHDGDFKVTQPQQIVEIYNRKRTFYTEGTIYPALRMEDFKQELFPIIRNLIRSNNPQHPWLSLDDESMLQMAGLLKTDYQTGQKGYTLAAALLLGRDHVIQQILPHYKIDALLRKVDTDRYDDREYIQTNLIEAYDQLMAFVAKHLPDRFYMEGDQRVSLRTKIFREIVANLIVHREYTNALPATFIIYQDRVETQNANNPHGEGPIDPKNFEPFAKNPTIAKFFIQLGRVDELGSGVINVNKYMREYAGKGKPQFIEGHTFKMHIPINEGVSEGVNEGVSEAIAGIFNNANGKKLEKLTEILAHVIATPATNTTHTAAIVNLSPKSVERYIKELREADVIEFKGAPKTGGYHVTEAFKRKLEQKKKSNK